MKGKNIMETDFGSDCFKCKSTKVDVSEHYKGEEKHITCLDCGEVYWHLKDRTQPFRYGNVNDVAPPEHGKPIDDTPSVFDSSDYGKRVLGKHTRNF